MLRVLLEHGADPNVNDSAALYTASRHGARDRCELLLAHGAKPNLLTAARRGMVDRMRGLLDAGPTSARRQQILQSALDEAVHCGQHAAAEFLIERGARLTLIQAAGLGMLSKVKEFIAANPASVNPTDGSETPLMAAAHHGHTRVMRFLLDNGADVQLGRKESVHTIQPIHVASEAAVDLLVEAGAEVNTPYRGFTPLQRALSKGDQELARAVARHGGTKRFYLVGHLREKLIEPLLALGADVNETDEDGRTALDYALENQQNTANEAPATSKRFEVLADLLRKQGAKTGKELQST